MLGKSGLFWVAEGQRVCVCVILLPQRTAGCSQHGTLYHQKPGGFGLMLSLSPPGQASSPALLAGGTKSLLACSGTAGADAGSFPTLENPSPSSSSERDLLMLPPWPCCFWVAHGETGPSTDALPIPASRHFHRAGAKLRSLGMESGLGGQKPAPAQGGGGQDRGLRVPDSGCRAQHPLPVPHTVPQTSHWGLTPQSPP